MSGLEHMRSTTNKFYDKVEGEYLLDLKGTETYCSVHSERYDEIYKKPTISYHFSFENYKLRQLGDKDNDTFEPTIVDPVSGVTIANFKRKPEYRLPFSETGYKSHFSGFIDLKTLNFKSTEDVIVEVSKWMMIDAGYKRKKYFCTKRFADVPIVSIIKRI